MGSRQKILECASELFYRKGYIATSVDDILAMAEVSKSNFYYHYKSKEDLGLAVLCERQAEMETLLKAALANPELQPLQRLAALLERMVERQTQVENAGCPFGNLVAEMAEHSDRFREHLSQLFESLTTSFEALVAEGQVIGQFRDDVEPSDMALLLVQTTQGMQLMTKCHRSAETMERAGEAMLRLMRA